MRPPRNWEDLPERLTPAVTSEAMEHLDVALRAHHKLCLAHAAILLAHHRNLLVFCGVRMELDLMSESKPDIVGKSGFAELIPG